MACAKSFLPNEAMASNPAAESQLIPHTMLDRKTKDMPIGEINSLSIKYLIYPHKFTRSQKLALYVNGTVCRVQNIDTSNIVYEKGT